MNVLKLPVKKKPPVTYSFDEWEREGAANEACFSGNFEFCGMNFIVEWATLNGDYNGDLIIYQEGNVVRRRYDYKTRTYNIGYMYEPPAISKMFDEYGISLCHAAYDCAEAVMETFWNSGEL